MPRPIAHTGTETFAFVGTIDLSALGAAFTLDAGQTITGFGNNNGLRTAPSSRPTSQAISAPGGTVTADEAVVGGGANDLFQLYGDNEIRHTTFDFTGGAGAIFFVDELAAGFSNASGITIEGVTIDNVAAGQFRLRCRPISTAGLPSSTTTSTLPARCSLNGGDGD